LKKEYEPSRFDSMGYNPTGLSCAGHKCWVFQ